VRTWVRPASNPRRGALRHSGFLGSTKLWGSRRAVLILVRLYGIGNLSCADRDHQINYIRHS
jgi:hypothetical protein